MIICVNVIPTKQNAAFAAVVSRCDQFEMYASNEEIVDLMRSHAAKGFRDLSPDDCRQVIDFIEEEAGLEKQLSLRLLGPALRKLRYAREVGVDWRLLVRTQLQNLGGKSQAVKRVDTKNQDLRTIQEVMNKHPASPQQQQVHWCEVTGKSRASYFRCLQRYREKMDK